MSARQPRLDRLEARLDRQAARLDELYRLLEREGIVPLADAPRGDAFFGELVQVEDSPPARARKRPPRRRRSGLRVGDATGV